MPDRFIDAWKLINPLGSWITLVAIAAIGFANCVLLRLYGGGGLLFTAVLGGLVNSSATVAAGIAVLPIAVMSGGAFALAWFSHSSAEWNHDLKLSSPGLDPQSVFLWRIVTGDRSGGRPLLGDL